MPRLPSKPHLAMLYTHGTPSVLLSAPKSPLFGTEKSSLLQESRGEQPWATVKRKGRVKITTNVPTDSTWAQQKNLRAMAKHRACTKQANIQRRAENGI